jgi:hypothetical protein
MMVLHQILAETFGNFWITNIHIAGSVEDHWPARSPDLNVNHLKSIIYRLPINSEADLRVRIQEAFVSVTEEMITKARFIVPYTYRVSTTKPGHRHITHIKIIYEFL